MEIEIIGMLLSALGASVTAGVYAYTSYVKTHAVENFDYGKLFRTVGLAAGVGFIVSFWQQPESILLASPIYALAGIVLENIGKWFKRKLLPYLKKKFGW